MLQIHPKNCVLKKSNQSAQEQPDGCKGKLNAARVKWPRRCRLLTPPMRCENARVPETMQHAAIPI